MVGRMVFVSGGAPRRECMEWRTLERSKKGAHTGVAVRVGPEADPSVRAAFHAPGGIAS